MKRFNNQPINPPAKLTICKGTATFISFFTPEREVNVDEPVKFMAKKDEIADIIKNQLIFSTTVKDKNSGKN